MLPAAGDETRARRPTCGTLVDSTGNPARPFCSVVCKLIDPGGWLDETYRIPDEPREGRAEDDPQTRPGR